MAVTLFYDSGLHQQSQPPVVRRSARLGHQQPLPTTATTATTPPAPNGLVTGSSTTAARTKSSEIIPSLSNDRAEVPKALRASRKRPRTKERQNSHTESDSDSESRRPLRPSVPKVILKSAEDRPVKAIRASKVKVLPMAPVQAQVSAPEPTPRSLRAQKRQRLSGDIAPQATTIGEDTKHTTPTAALLSTPPVATVGTPIARRTRASKRTKAEAVEELKVVSKARVVASKKRRVKLSTSKAPIELVERQSQVQQDADLLSGESRDDAKHNFSDTVVPSVEEITKTSSESKGEAPSVTEESIKDASCDVETKTCDVTRESSPTVTADVTAPSTEPLESEIIQAEAAPEAETGDLSTLVERAYLRPRRIGAARTPPKALKQAIARKSHSPTPNPITGKTRASSLVSAHKAAGGRRVGRPPKTRTDTLPSDIFTIKITGTTLASQDEAARALAASAQEAVLQDTPGESSLSSPSVAPALTPPHALPTESPIAPGASCPPKSPQSSNQHTTLHVPVQPYVHSPLSPLAHTTSPPGSPPSRFSRTSPPLGAIDLGPLEPLALPNAAVQIAKGALKQAQDDINSGRLPLQATMSQSQIIAPQQLPAADTTVDSFMIQSLPTSDLLNTFDATNGFESPIQPLPEVHMAPASKLMPVTQQSSPHIGVYEIDMSVSMPVAVRIDMSSPMGNPSDISGMNMDMAPQSRLMPSDHGVDMSMDHADDISVLNESDLEFDFQPQDGFDVSYDDPQPSAYMDQPPPPVPEIALSEPEIALSEAETNLPETQTDQPQPQPAQAEDASTSTTTEEASPPVSSRIQMHVVGERPTRRAYTAQPRNRFYVRLEGPENPKETCIWKIAAQARVTYLARTYTAEVLRDIVAQDAHDYYTRTGFFPLGYNSSNVKPRRSTLSASQSSMANMDDDDDDEFMSEKTYAFELADDDEGDDYDDDDDDDSDEDEDMIDVLAEAEKNAAAVMSGDEDAEGEMEVDIEAYSDPSFNAELSSSSTSSAVVSPAPTDGCQTNFYVPPAGTYHAQYDEQDSWDSQASEMQPMDQGQEQHHYQQHAQIQLTPASTAAPILPLPPPRLSSIHVPHLINHAWAAAWDVSELKGTPRNRVRGIQWSRGYNRWCSAKLAAEICRKRAEDRARGIFRPANSRKNQKRKADDELDEESEARGQPKMRLYVKRRNLRGSQLRQAHQRPFEGQQEQMMTTPVYHHPFGIQQPQQSSSALQPALQQQFEMQHQQLSTFGHAEQQQCLQPHAGVQLTEAMPEPVWESFLTNFDDKQTFDQAPSVPQVQIPQLPLPIPHVTIERQQLPVASTSAELSSALTYTNSNLAGPPRGSSVPVFSALNIFDFSDLDVSMDGSMGGGVNGENSDSPSSGGGTSTLSFALG